MVDSQRPAVAPVSYTNLDVYKRQPFMFIDPTSGAARIGFSIVYGAFAVFIVDTFVMWIQLRRRYAEEFGTKPPGGSFFYAMSRTMSFRRTRMPQPRVSRGQRWVKPGK